MKTCSTCGKSNEDSSIFCNQCGSSFPEPAPIPSESNTVVTEIPQETQRTSHSKKIILPVLIILGIIAILVTAYFLFGKSDTASKSADTSIAYIKNNTELSYYSNSGSTPLLLSSTVNHDEYAQYLCDELTNQGLLVQKSPNGKKIAYLDSVDSEEYSGDLCLANTLSEKEAAEGEEVDNIQISSRVLLFCFIDDTQIAYIKIDNNENEYEITGDLFIYNITDESSKKLASGIDYFTISADGKSLLLIKNASDEYYMDCFDLYLQGLEDDTEKTKIDSKIISIEACSPDLTQIVYLRESAKDEMNCDIYRYTSANESELLISDAYAVISASPDGSLYYYKGYEKTLTIDDILEDDLAASDAEMIDPEYLDFYTTETEYDYYWGEYYTYDSFDYEAYDAAYYEYEDKLFRDEIRNYINENPITYVVTDLYSLSSDGNETKIDSDVDSVSLYNASGNGILYSKKMVSSSDKVKMSNVGSAEDIPYYSSDLDSSAKYAYYILTNDDQPFLLFDSKTGYEEFFIDNDWTKLYYLYTKEEETNGVLYSFDLKNNQASNQTEIMTDVWNVEIEENGTLMILADVKDFIGDLYTFADSKEKMIGSDLQFSSVLSLGNDEYYFIENYNEKTASGDFSRFSNGEKAVLEADVYDYEYFSGNLIYLYKDYNDSKYIWDIYLYDGSEKIKNIDYDVSDVQFFHQRSSDSLIDFFQSYSDM